VPADGLCPGPCNSRYRKAQALYKEILAGYDEAMRARALAADDTPEPAPDPPGPPSLRPWSGDPVWCARCASGIHQELSELDDLIAMLLAVPDLRADPGQAGKISGTKGRRSPSPYTDDADELAEWARSWESAARDTDTAPRRGHLSSETTATLAWLGAHFHVLIGNQDMAADFGQETRDWHAGLKRKARAGTATRPMGRPCPRCRLYTLWLTDGDEHVRCINTDCQRLLSREEYDELEEGRVTRVRRGA
jgi:hypothetical protein